VGGVFLGDFEPERAGDVLDAHIRDKEGMIVLKLNAWDANMDRICHGVM
jgi:hypothetical protein